MKKKLSVANQVLNLLNTKGGFTVRQIIAETKAKAPNVYNAVNTLRRKKMIAREEDGVYISQTQTSTTPVSNPTNKPKRGRPCKGNTVKVKPIDFKTLNDKYIKSLEAQVYELENFCDEWRQNYNKLEADYTQAKIMYLNSQAVVSYLEEKVAQLIRG